MPEIDVTPIVLEDSILTIDGDDYAAACSAVTFTPTNTTVKFRGLKRAQSFTAQTPSDWSLAITFAQDIALPASLTNFLLEHEGETVAAVFRPQSGIGPSIHASIILSAGALGGTSGAVPTSSVTMGVFGTPTVVPAA